MHICHVARREEILVIRAAKEKGLAVTCEVPSLGLHFTQNLRPAYFSPRMAQ